MSRVTLRKTRYQLPKVRRCRRQQEPAARLVRKRDRGKKSRRTPLTILEQPADKARRLVRPRVERRDPPLLRRHSPFKFDPAAGHLEGRCEQGERLERATIAIQSPHQIVLALDPPARVSIESGEPVE